MKKIVLSLAAIIVAFAGVAQQQLSVPNSIKDHAVKSIVSTDATLNLDPAVNPNASVMLKSGIVLGESIVGTTRYDLQSNVSTRNQLWKWEDGTMSTVFTIGEEDPSFADRGTGYNFNDGQAWQPAPTERLESQRTGWGCIAPWGPNGEVVVSHSGTDDGLVVMTRAMKGEGEWTTHFLVGPADNPDLLWPRVMTSGDQNQYIHIISITPPEANSGTIHQGLDGALLYARSADGGESWDYENEILPETGSEDYVGYVGDVYTFVHSTTTDNVAFVVADDWKDLFIMESVDNGESWNKTVVWEHPYPMFQTTDITDTFYCPDGAASITYDNGGRLHLAFAINRAYSDGTGQFWFPGVGGIAYWNSDMEPFESNNFKTTLDPVVLDESGHLIGFLVDLDGDGEFDWTLGSDGIPPYYLGTSSMPNLILVNDNTLLLTYSALTDGRNNGTLIYRSLFGTISMDGGDNWFSREVTGGTACFSEDLIHMIDECVFPSMAPYQGNDEVDLVYQYDVEPGLAVRGQEHSYVDNSYSHMRLSVYDFVVGVEENEMEKQTLQISPNPVQGLATMVVPVDATLTIVSLTGQVVKSVVSVKAGQSVTMDMTGFSAGIYFVVAETATTTITEKIIVQ